MPRRRQCSIAALMVLVFCTGVALSLRRDREISPFLTILTFTGLLFIVLAWLVSFSFGCIHLAIGLFRWLRPRQGRATRASATSKPSLMRRPRSSIRPVPTGPIAGGSRLLQQTGSVSLL
jgi:hypothetical protein